MKGLILCLFFAGQAFANSVYESQSDFIIALSIEGKLRSKHEFIESSKKTLENILDRNGIFLGRDQEQYHPLSYNYDHYIAVFKVSLPSILTADMIITELEQEYEVYWVHANLIYEGDFADFSVNDPAVHEQYFLRKISAFNAWDIQAGDKDVIVAVTDDGFDINHPDLINSFHINDQEVPGNGIDDDKNGYIDDVLGWNFNGNNNDISDNEWFGDHGTHITGIIAAGADNGIGGASVSPGISVMPLKFYGQKRWSSAMVYGAFSYAVENGAKIINCSYSVDLFVETRDPVFFKAIDYAYEKDVLMFMSAGNNNKTDNSRMELDKVLFVSNLDEQDQKYKWSNYSYQVDIAAPGTNIYSTRKNNRYGSKTGTSMASPIAAATAALIMSEFPGLSAEQVVHKLVTSVDKISSGNILYNHMLGSGRVNAYSALENSINPLSIEVAEFKNGYKIDSDKLTLVIKGVVGDYSQPIRITSFGNDNILQTLDDNEMDFDIYPEMLNIGSNFLEIDISHFSAGLYHLSINSRNLEDVFGYELDGDNDGVAGGDLAISFEKI